MNSPLLNVMSAAAIKAGKGLMRDFGEVDHLQISRKGTANFVTSADLRTEKLLQRELLKARPEFGFLLEEGGEVPGRDGVHRWIIDPLDGTSNFIHAIPYFCISIGLEKKEGSRSEIIAAVIFDPIHNDLFTAEKGQGAFLNGNRKLAVSVRPALEEAMLVTGGLRFQPQDDGSSLSIFESLPRQGAIIRDFGATALDLAYLAAGRIDACWHYTIQPWDIAAGLLLVREAGGQVTDLNGQTADIYAKSLLATNRHLHPPMQKLLAKSS